MNSKYTGKQVEYLLDKINSLSSGDVGDFIGTGLLDKFLRKDQDERTPHSLASDKKLEVGNFVSGTAGAVIYIDEQTKHSVAEIDKLYVRLKAYFEQLEIINVNSVGGKQIISPAGGIKCSQVETYDSWGYYRCYFLSEQDGEKIENRFAVGDQAYSKTFNAKEGSYNKISNRYYWRLVVGVGENYIDLSKTDCDADSDEPQEGDVIVHRGNRNDVDRQNCLEFSSVDSFSPSITLYQGINDYSLADKNVIQFGVEKSTGKAFMNVYGDMFIGNRDNSSYIRYSPEKGVEIKGKLDIGTSFGDKTLQDAIDQASTAYEEDLNNLKDIVSRDIENIQNQLDGAIETWFYDPIPTLTNLPASQWATEADRNMHLGDLYYSGAGRAYRFQYDADNSLYYWQEIIDTDIVLALENAKKAQDTADSKRKIFVRKPEASDSYDIGDMWVNATYSDGNITYTEDLLRAITAKKVGEQFSINHWTLASKYTDDTVANDALQKATEAQNSVNELQNSVGDFKDYVNNAFLDGIIDTSEAQAIEKYINQLDTIKLQVDKSYEEIIKNSILENTQYLTNLNNSYTAFSSSYTELIDTINSAISDSKTTDLEKAAVDGKYKTFNDKYRDYTAYLNQAINYIEETINGKVERALQDIGGYKYLKAALQENTSIEGGLIQSSMLSLGYTKNNQFLVMAGTNGLVLDKGDRTIASWFGGGMIDMFDYYDSNTKTFNVPENVRAAAGLDRMDGTGYRAKGNLWWDESGVVHADPLSFFVGESTVGGLLASFQVVMKEDGKHPQYLIPQVPFQSLEIADYIRIGDALLKYDSVSKAIYVTSADGATSMGFYASGYVSAKGANSSSSGGGGASALYQLVDVVPNSTNDGVLNATNGSVLMYNGSKWQAGNVVTDISPLTLNVNGSSLFTYDGKSSITANLTVPTKVSQLTNDSGYLTAITKAQVEGVLTGNITSHTHSYLPLSGGTLTGALYMNASIYGPAVGSNPRNIYGIGSYFFNCASGNTSAYSFGLYQWLDEFQFTYRTSSDNVFKGNAFTIQGSDGQVAFTKTPKVGSTLVSLDGHTHSYLPLSGGTLGSTSIAETWLNLNSSTAKLMLCSFSNGANYIESVNVDDSANATLNITGRSGNIGSTLNLNFATITTRGSYTNIDSGNYNSYTPTLTGTGASGTWGISITGNAATLDGYHASDFARSRGSVLPTDINYLGYGYADNSWYTYGPAFTFGVDKYYARIQKYYSTNTLYLGGYSTELGDLGWREFAFTDSNVASATNADMLDGLHASSFLLRVRMTNPSNGTSYHGAIPFPLSLKSAGFPVYTDPEFASGNNSVEVYNNKSNGTVTISRIADNQGSANSSGYILQISTTSGEASPGRGGFYQNIQSRQNAVFAQIFRAKIPIGFSVVKGENHMGNGYTTFWLTDTAGTGKWEWYIRITICGSGGNYSSGGHVYLNGSGAVTWYLAYCNVIDLTKGNYDGLRTLCADKLQTARTLWGQSFNGTANVSGALTGVTDLTASGTIRWNGSDGRYTKYAQSIVCYIQDRNGWAGGIGWVGTDGVTYSQIGHYGDYVYFGPGAYNTPTNYILDSNGYMGLGIRPTVRLHVAGDIAATGAVTAKASSSDIRLKTDITDYKALSIIRNHKSIKYHWNEVAKANADIFNDNYWHYGLIAQDVQRDMPQMVSDVFKDYLVINYERLIPICWKGLQEVDDEVTKLKKKVRKLEMEIRELKQKEDRL